MFLSVVPWVALLPRTSAHLSVRVRPVSLWCSVLRIVQSMTLTSVLRSLPEFELVTLNFSSTTTPKLLLDTLSHHCKVTRTPAGLVMQPNTANRWLVLFCDEINLPANDAYHTQHVITFLRQLSEHGGYWRPSDLSFVRLERVQVLGACNPPTDAGRVALTPRFLRHCPLVFVDFPAVPSLKQIYGTFNRALLKLVPSLRSYSEALTDAMIEVYQRSQARFTPDIQPQYVFSPRELSRWVRALYEAMKPPDTPGGGGSTTSAALSPTELVRLWAHEALRLFQDRLVDRAEREWTDVCVDDVARKHFPSVDLRAALSRPILFSNWLTRHYTSVSSVGAAGAREDAAAGVQRGGAGDQAGGVRRGAGPHPPHRPRAAAAAGPSAAGGRVGRREDHPQPLRGLDERHVGVPDQGAQVLYRQGTTFPGHTRASQCHPARCSLPPLLTSLSVCALCCRTSTRTCAPSSCAPAAGRRTSASSSTSPTC